jgi:hypothetical protein
MYVAQTGLELEILLSQDPDCWDYRHVPQLLAKYDTKLTKYTIKTLDYLRK